MKAHEEQKRAIFPSLIWGGGGGGGGGLGFPFRSVKKKAQDNEKVRQI